MSVDLACSTLSASRIDADRALEPIDGVRRQRRRRPCEHIRKRKQIIRGAQDVFLRFGFDAASMADLSRAAGVSKGTLYLYFEDKEHLFLAVCEAACEGFVNSEVALCHEGGSLREALIISGLAVVTALCRPDRVDWLRVLIGTGGRMPAIGRHFLETIVRPPIASLADFLARQVEAGTVAIADCELAAEQLVDACLVPALGPMVFGAGSAPTRQRISQVVSSAVDCFLAGCAPSIVSRTASPV